MRPGNTLAAYRYDCGRSSDCTPVVSRCLEPTLVEGGGTRLASPAVSIVITVRLPALSPVVAHRLTETAQRFLDSAYDSVKAVLATLDTIRDVRKQQTGDVRGRLTAQEEDLLRAAIVFPGAGLDATLKQLIRDTLPDLLESSTDAHEKFETFATERISSVEGADPKMVARYLTSQVPRDRLIDDYVWALTGSSLQSAEEVQRTAGALGITDSDLRKRISNMRPVFVARNEISHELDLQRPGRPGDRTRRSRGMQPSAELCHQALDIGQAIVNAVVPLL